MVSRYALIQGGIVDNVVLWDGDTTTWRPPEGQEAIRLESEQAVDIGWSYDGSEFYPPEQPE